MWKAERFQRIRTSINTFGKLTIEQAARELDVSTETIRRDLSEMESMGELRRIRGGAILPENEIEPPITQRLAEQVKEKQSMAKTAALLVHSGQMLFVDAGSTTTILAESLALLSGITVITNSVEVAVRMSQLGSRVTNGNSAILLGGKMNESIVATYGDKTIGEICSYRVDAALVSPVGLDGNYGATSFDPAEAEIAKAMFANARKKILLADHTKLGVVSRVSYCKAAEIDVLVTDARSLKCDAYPIINKAVGAVYIEGSRV